jgi:hypothetical protein
LFCHLGKREIPKCKKHFISSRKNIIEIKLRPPEQWFFSESKNPLALHGKCGVSMHLFGERVLKGSMHEAKKKKEPM